MSILGFLNKYAEETIGALLLSVMSLIAFTNVIVRYCTNFSFAWTEEMTVNLFVWAVMLGTSAVFRDSEHLSMNVFYNLLSARLKKFCNVLSVLICLIFFITLSYFGYLEVIDEMELEAISESLGIPQWWYTVSVPLLSLLIVFRILQRACFGTTNTLKKNIKESE